MVILHPDTLSVKEKSFCLTCLVFSCFHVDVVGMNWNPSSEYTHNGGGGGEEPISNAVLSPWEHFLLMQSDGSHFDRYVLAAPNQKFQFTLSII